MMELTYCCGAMTDRGDIRTENQDSILYLVDVIEGQTAALFAVADGMGGLSYGAQVSRYIIEQFERWWYEDLSQMLRVRKDTDEDIQELLEQEIWDVNQAVRGFNSRMGCRSGSTLSLLLLYKQRYYIENIGDSRVYRWRKRCLRQLTKDQSMVAQMVREHRISQEEAEGSKLKNILTMCIGMFPVPQSEHLTGRVHHGDRFLLCSDGCYHPLEKKQIKGVLGDRKLDAQEKAESLRQMIEPGGASDNVSIIIVEVDRAGQGRWRR